MPAKTRTKPGAKTVRAARKRTTKSTSSNRLDVFLKSIHEQFRQDHVAPGLVLSVLPNGKFYASIARYSGPNKTVVDSVIGESLLEALTGLGKLWRAYLDYQTLKDKPITQI